MVKVMNSQVHFQVGTIEKIRLKDEARGYGISLSEYCRMMLLGSSQLDRIENKLKELIKNGRF